MSDATYLFTRAQLDEVVRCAIATTLDEATGMAVTPEQATDIAMSEMFESLNAEQWLAHRYALPLSLQLPLVETADTIRDVERQTVLNELTFGITAHEVAITDMELSVAPAAAHQGAITALKQTLRRLRSLWGIPEAVNAN